MSSFVQYKDAYVHNWNNLAIRQNRLPEINHTCGIILRNKPRYVKCTHLTGVPWWFIALQHYRESDFDFNTYLGNGQSLHHRTTIVPAGRGPWDRFEDGVFDAEKIEAFVGAVNWSLARSSYRIEGFNGFGYHAHGVNSPYLYGGSRLYGPPEARGGKYVGDHDFSSSAVDSQLGTLTILKRLIILDDSISFTDKPTMQPEPDETKEELVTWVQQALNMVEKTNLVVDGMMGKLTMNAIMQFQKDNSIDGTGLPDKATVTALQQVSTSKRVVPRPLPPPPASVETVYPFFNLTHHPEV